MFAPLLFASPRLLASISKHLVPRVARDRAEGPSSQAQLASPFVRRLMLLWRIANTAGFRVRTAATTGKGLAFAPEVFVRRPIRGVFSEAIDDVVVEHSL